MKECGACSGVTRPDVTLGEEIGEFGIVRLGVGERFELDRSFLVFGEAEVAHADECGDAGGRRFFLEGGKSLLEVAKFEPGEAEIQVEIRKGRINGSGALIGLDGFAIFGLLGKTDAEICLGDGGGFVWRLAWGY